MSLDIAAALNALVSHAMAGGHFERVNTHESVNAPGSGLTADVWGQHIIPIQGRSGLDSTSVRVLFVLRIFTGATPSDDLDLLVMAAAGDLMARYTANLTLGGSVSNIDLLGAHGIALKSELGYQEKDKKLLRIATMTIPLIFNNVWTQGA